MRPVWLCPVRRAPGPGRRTRSSPGRCYVNVGFWGTVHVGPEAADAPLNRAIEQVVHELGGHKSLYSEAFYDRATFDALYDGDHLARVKAQLRSRRPADRPLRQGGATTMTDDQSDPDRSIAEAVDSLMRDGMPLRFTAYDGSAVGPPDSPISASS